MILIVGASGDLGQRVTGNLRDRGEPVRALLRPGSEPPNVVHDLDIVQGDLTDSASLVPACQGVSTVVLPAAQAATGSAVVNMSRQIGTALGVSLVVAVLGTPIGYAAAHTAFQHVWTILAAVAVLAALTAPPMTPTQRVEAEPVAPAELLATEITIHIPTAGHAG